MSNETFGAPEAADLLLALGDVYLTRGALPEGVRLFVSVAPLDVAIATLQLVVIELSASHACAES